MIRFLNTELDLASTFCDVAETSSHHEHSVLLAEKTREVLETVRHFEGRITDGDEQANIQKKAHELAMRVKLEELNAPPQVMADAHQ